MKRIFLLLTTLLALLGGCGESTNLVTPVAPFTPTVYRIGVIAPLDGGQTEFGRGIRNSVQLAVEQWNQARAPIGPFFEVVALDDSSTPAVGAAAARQLAADPTVVGVVGTYNSGVAAEVAPILEAAGIPLISPGNTDPVLTVGADPANPVRQYDNYFRLVVPDTLQGPALAEYAYNAMSIRRVAVVTESKEVSQGLADAFSARFVELGGTILITQVVPEGTTDYSTILANVAATNPQLLFYGGEVPNASIVKTQAIQAGITAPLMGGDGVKTQSYIDNAPAAGTEGDIASSVGAPVSDQYMATYEAAGFVDPPSDFGPYAYDAANLLIAATVANNGNRAGILNFLETVDIQGVTGRLSFDAFGDTLNEVLTIYRVFEGVFVPQNVEILD